MSHFTVAVITANQSDKEGKKLSGWELKYINAQKDEELYQAEIDEYEQYDEERK